MRTASLLFFTNCVYQNSWGEPVNFRVELKKSENFAELGPLLRRGGLFLMFVLLELLCGWRSGYVTFMNGA